MSTISAGTTTTTALVQTGDTTGNLVLQTGSTPTTALTLDTSQNATFAGSITSAGSSGSLNSANTFGFKNRIINGGMVINQRGSSGTVTSGAYQVDRFKCFLDTSPLTLTFTHSTTAPAGFSNSAQFTVTSAGTVTSGQGNTFLQAIEGFNTADLGFGTANAKTVTLSFWVRSSVTGTFGGSITNGTNTRSYPFTYTISSANTFEQKSVTIPGDTTGTWVGSTNGSGMIVWFSFGTGSTLSGTAGTWAGTNYISATGATNIIGTSGATFYITGVQFEVGSQATSFDFRDYGRELILCQRYYTSGIWFPGYFNGSGSVVVNSFPMPCALRTTPSMSYTGTLSGTLYGSATYFSTDQPSFISSTSNTSSSISFVVSGFGSTPVTGALGIGGQTIKISAEL